MLDLGILAKRIAQIESERVTLIVWKEPILPRQRVDFRVGPPFTELFHDLAQRNDTAVMVGSNAHVTELLSHAVSVQLESYRAYSDGTATVQVRGLRR